MVTKITVEQCSNDKRHTWRRLRGLSLRWCSKCGSILDGDLYIPTEATRLSKEISDASWNGYREGY